MAARSEGQAAEIQKKLPGGICNNDNTSWLASQSISATLQVRRIWAISRRKMSSGPQQNRKLLAIALAFAVFAVACKKAEEKPSETKKPAAKSGRKTKKKKEIKLPRQR
jgi:hypothetical protein